MAEYMERQLNAQSPFTVTGSMKAGVGTASKTFNGTGSGRSIVLSNLNKPATEGAWTEEEVGSFDGNGHSGEHGFVTDDDPAP